jgi:hypothetical protein
MHKPLVCCVIKCNLQIISVHHKGRTGDTASRNIPSEVCLKSVPQWCTLSVTKQRIIRSSLKGRNLVIITYVRIMGVISNTYTFPNSILNILSIYILTVFIVFLLLYITFKYTICQSSVRSCHKQCTRRSKL